MVGYVSNEFAWSLSFDKVGGRRSRKKEEGRREREEEGGGREGGRGRR
jgi:hypothetical protein